MARKKLTQKFIDNGPPVPNGKDKIEYCDIALPGLLLEQRAANSEWGSFRYRYKNAAGKTSYVTLGRSCDMTLQEARKRTKQLMAEVQLGADPQAKIREQRKSLTWNAFYKDYYLPHVKQHKRSWKNDDDMHRLRISPRFGNTKLNRFSRREVQQWLNSLRGEGLAPATCDHHAKLLRQALNLAVQWELIDKNPLEGIKLFGGDNRVENVLTDEQLQTLLDTLDKVSEERRVASLVIKFLLFTGARVNEALHARWDDVDRDKCVWTVHATNSKSKQRRFVPLNESAVAVLEALDSEGRSKWLFTSRHGDGNQRMTTINKVWDSIRKDAGFPKLRLHDLRHNFASILVNSGRTLYEVQQILGHSDHSVTERYAHLAPDRLQDAASSITNYLKK